MKKPEKNQTKKLAKIKRGLKRTQRMKDSRKVVASKRKQNLAEKLMKEKKINEMIEKMIQSRLER